MKIKAALDLSNVGSWEELRRYAADTFRQIIDIVNGRIAINDNLDVDIVTYTFAAADTNTAIPHGLGRIPVGYIVSQRSAALTVYDGGSDNTSEIIYLKSSALGSVTLVIF